MKPILVIVFITLAFSVPSLFMDFSKIKARDHRVQSQDQTALVAIELDQDVKDAICSRTSTSIVIEREKAERYAYALIDSLGTGGTPRSQKKIDITIAHEVADLQTDPTARAAVLEVIRRISMPEERPR